MNKKNCEPPSYEKAVNIDRTTSRILLKLFSIYKEHFIHRKAYLNFEY